MGIWQDTPSDSVEISHRDVSSYIEKVWLVHCIAAKHVEKFDVKPCNFNQTVNVIDQLLVKNRLLINNQL